MVVIVLSACPAGLRGYLSRWLLEVSAGVFVGTASSRVRDLMWASVVDLCKDGRALMVYQVRSEQRLSFRTHRHHWETVDIDGLILVRRPADPSAAPARSPSSWARKAKARRRRGGGGAGASRDGGDEK